MLYKDAEKRIVKYLAHAPKQTTRMRPSCSTRQAMDPHLQKMAELYVMIMSQNYL